MRIYIYICIHTYIVFDAIGRQLCELYIRAIVYVLLPFVYDMYACDVKIFAIKKTELERDKCEDNEV